MTAPLETAHAGGCWKKTFTNRAQAMLEADRIQISVRQHVREKNGKKRRKIERSRRAHPTAAQRAYECPQCGLWHLTSQEPNR